MARKELVERVCAHMLGDLVKFEPNAAVARCPLCLEPFVLDETSPQRPTAEHIVQRSLGGTLLYPTATHKECNNDHGSNVESDLKSAMDVLDFMEGNGTVPLTIKNGVGHVAANLIWTSEGPTIKILGKKASNMKAVETVPSMIRENATLSFSLHFVFSGEAYRRAIFRVGYLSMFREFGYDYAFSGAAAAARTAMTAEIPPDGVILEAFPSVEPPVPYFNLQSKDLLGALVVFKVRSRMTRWLAVLLPGNTVPSWDVLKNRLRNVHQMRIGVGFEKFGILTTISFDRDPVQRMLEIRVPAA